MEANANKSCGCKKTVDARAEVDKEQAKAACNCGESCSCGPDCACPWPCPCNAAKSAQPA